MGDKIKVRIAVAVNAEGKFSVTGWKPTSANYDNAAMELAANRLPNATGFYWIEAELAIPEVTTIKGHAALAEGKS